MTRNFPDYPIPKGSGAVHEQVLNLISISGVESSRNPAKGFIREMRVWVKDTPKTASDRRHLD